MAFEIEVKARVTDVDALRAKLHAVSRGVYSFVKEDLYFAVPEAPRGTVEFTLFRLRRENGDAIVTHKKRTMIGNVEENREVEFTVTDADAFELFALSLGYVVSIRKRKTGEQYEIAASTLATVVELTEIDGLGWFAEIEILLPDDADDSQRDAARREIEATLKRLNIPRASIEPRRYTDMLAELTS